LCFGTVVLDFVFLFLFSCKYIWEQEMCESQNTPVYINYQTVKYSIYINGPNPETIYSVKTEENLSLPNTETISSVNTEENPSVPHIVNNHL
jgi:hypothetical protein